MRQITILCFTAVLLCFAGSACGNAPAQSGAGGSKTRAAVASNQLQFTVPAAGSTIATLATSKGDITVVLYPEHAGRAVDNFVKLAEQGTYNNTVFHRVVNNFIIQGGDPTGTGEGGESCWGTGFGTEVSTSLRHYSGALCMAAKGGLNGSQFYIVATPPGGFTDSDIAQLQQQGMPAEAAETYCQAGGAPYLDNTDTVFGQVIAGMDVVDEIASTQTNTDERPKTEIKLLSVTFSSYVPPPVVSTAPAASAAGSPSQADGLPQVTVPG
ncbi:peptidylprolyl isomerase [Ruminococcaceae bacterium OttesenSCG-928-A16]|nr:peptidylprolyl isomerase [Ruminococcaceae bacterium OttesenSCG-928-A16]